MPTISGRVLLGYQLALHPDQLPGSSQVGSLLVSQVSSFQATGGADCSDCLLLNAASTLVTG